MDLHELRKKIDETDSGLVRLYEERMELCRQVAEYKRNTGKPVLDAEREREKLAAVRQMASKECNRDGLESVFKLIMANSRQLQESLINGDAASDR